MAKSAQYLNQAIEKDPNFALAYLYLFRTGIEDTEERQEYLAKAVSLVDKVSPGEKLFILYYMAVTYEKMGEKDKANELYKELENRKQNDLALALVKHNIKKMTAK